ncbi:methyltransferase domain-containing protein [Flavobacteriaceae bacterium F08102]|nr:methyltransferase domain-containing protein [Flavobacteriaceae bacterium F08102]
MEKKRVFFKEAIKNIKTSGTITPSSKYLATKMLKSIDFKQANVIVEYGAGNGIFTRKLLKKLNKDAILLCFEINEEFYKHLKTIKDDRLFVYQESCEHIKQICQQHDIKEVDCIVSSLPLTNIPNQISQKILSESFDILKKEGTFIQYQYSLSYHKKLKKIYPKVTLNFEVRNVPPAFIYYCKKY